MSTQWFGTWDNKSYWFNATDLGCNQDQACLDYCTYLPENQTTCMWYRKYDPKSDFWAPGYYISIVLGCVLICIQLVDVLLLLVPKTWYSGTSFLRELVTPASLKLESATKRAASHKMRQVVQNALAVHSAEEKTWKTQTQTSVDPLSIGAATAPDESYQRKNSHLKVLRQFHLQETKTEATGGIFVGLEEHLQWKHF